MPKSISSPHNRRRALRLNFIFPVSFKIVVPEGTDSRFDWLQGFSSNISETGLCLEVNNIRPEVLELLKIRSSNISLVIEIPIGGKPVYAQAKPVWFKEIHGEVTKVIVGLHYFAILPSQRDYVMRCARMKMYFTPASMSVVIFLGIAVITGSYFHEREIQANRQVVSRLVSAVQAAQAARSALARLDKEKNILQLELQVLQDKLAAAQVEKVQEVAQVFPDGIPLDRDDDSSALIARLTSERDDVQNKLDQVLEGEKDSLKAVDETTKRAVQLQKANMQKMYHWLKARQNHRTGLVMSFEDVNDKGNIAFVYDQALALIAYSLYGDFDRAKKLANFFQSNAQMGDNGFYNGYFASGGEPAEFIVYSGSNIWLGMALLQYTYRSRDTTFLPLAEDIAARAIALQNSDTEGGLRGNSHVAWFSSENNLDAYAFFNMLYIVTGKDQYVAARDKIVGWLKTNAYSTPDVLVNRGKGAAAIAPDTYAWSVVALGPEILSSIGVDPDELMSFAQGRCAVETDFMRPEGAVVKVKGFDFSGDCQERRTGIVSSEWTAQMVLSAGSMADYHRIRSDMAKAARYQSLAEEYTHSLNSLIISSPFSGGEGESCVPFATRDFVDTGHGWRSPKGCTTGSLAGTVYTMFALQSFNPLDLKGWRNV
jgi:hypothetical protein